MFVCVCGKEFKSKQALSGHQGYCKEYLGKDKYYEVLNKNKNAQLKAKQTILNNAKIKKQHLLNVWISEKHKCEKCGKIMTEKYASGRFCCKECARGFSNYKGLFGLTKDIDINDGDFKCPICFKCYRTKSGLSQHIKCNHNDYYNLNNYVIMDGKSIGITYQQLDEYRNKHTKCEICGKSIESIQHESNHFKKLCIDHNHNTNQFRGLLCMTCNRSLGWFEKNEQYVLKYLNNKGREQLLY